MIITNLRMDFFEALVVTTIVTTVPIKVYGSSLYLGSCCCRYTGSQADCGGATGDRPAAQIGSGASQECG